MKTIVISSQPGQLANQLIVYANFIAFCNEHGIKLKNPSFHRYSSYFEFTQNRYQSMIAYRIINYLMRFLNRFGLENRLINVVNIGFEDVMSLDDVRSLSVFRGIINLAAGWKFRGNQTLIKHKKLVLEKLWPCENHMKAIDDFFTSNKLINRIVIGIHVRRGDYKNFEGGKYFYDFTEYKKIIKSIALLFKGYNPIFLICSNDIDFEKNLNDLNCTVVFGPGHELRDLYCFSRCNYLIGPPSTFTMWASFVGNVPLCMVKDTKMNICIDDFNVIE
ncbi:MAG: alpha-1,2-fucosyltransferase, partial [Bacteroidota bacterium]